MANASPSKPSSRTKRPTQRPLASSSSRPFLRFYHSEALRTRTLEVLDTLEQAPEATAHREALADVLVELTNAGLDYYFLKPLQLAKAGFLVQQSAKLGLTGAQQVIGSVIRQIIGHMDRTQLLSVCGSIRQFML